MDFKEPDIVAAPTAEQLALERHRRIVRGLLIALLCIAVLYTLHTARTLIMPVVVALLFSLFLSPLVAVLKRAHIPRPISSLLLICLLGGPFVWLSIELAEPAQKWLKKLPELSATVTEQLEDISEQLAPDAPVPEAAVPEPAVPEPPAPAQKRRFSFFGLFDEPEPVAVAPVQAPEPAPEPEKESVLVEGVKQGGAEILLSMLAAAPVIVAQCVVWLVLVLFLLIFGPGLYTNFIDLLPMIRDKRRTALLAGRLRQELSRYIVTVTIINVGLGAATATTLWLLGVEDAVLWGVMVGLLNYAPYLGPVIAVGILMLAGVTQYGFELAALWPAFAYFVLNMVESQFVTPALLGQHMKLNPLILTLWLVIWGWLWGPVGVLIAVPLLLCLKLVAAQSEVLHYWVQFIETKY